jgi:predicted RNase H-like nuclease (RuvC/YqgF family)
MTTTNDHPRAAEQELDGQEVATVEELSQWSDHVEDERDALLREVATLTRAHSTLAAENARLRDENQRRYAKVLSDRLREMNALAESFDSLSEKADELHDTLRLIQGFDWRLDNSPHGQEIKRRALAALGESK